MNKNLKYGIKTPEYAEITIADLRATRAFRFSPPSIKKMLKKLGEVVEAMRA